MILKAYRPDAFYQCVFRFSCIFYPQTSNFLFRKLPYNSTEALETKSIFVTWNSFFIVRWSFHHLSCKRTIPHRCSPNYPNHHQNPSEICEHSLECPADHLGPMRPI